MLGENYRHRLARLNHWTKNPSAKVGLHYKYGVIYKLVMPKETELHVDIVEYPEDNIFVAECLEIPIIMQADTLEKVTKKINLAIKGHFEIFPSWACELPLVAGPGAYKYIIYKRSLKDRATYNTPISFDWFVVWGFFGFLTFQS